MIFPAVGSISRRIARPKVDFPQPDSPTSPTVSPDSMSRLTPSTAFTILRTGLPPETLSQIVPPPRSKWTFRSRMETSGLGIDLLREMTERLSPRRNLHQRWKLTAANVLNLVAPRRERTTRR